MDNEWFIMRDLFTFFECFHWGFSSTRIVKINRVESSRAKRCVEEIFARNMYMQAWEC